MNLNQVTLPSNDIARATAFPVDQTHSRLMARRIAFETAPTDQPSLWREAYVRDPDHNLLCFFQAGQNRRHPHGVGRFPMLWTKGDDQS